MTRIHMQHMAEGIPDGRLPQGWMDDLSHFSPTKRLFDYQQRALQNALKALWKYYEDFGNGPPHPADDANRQRKMRFWQWYGDNGLSEDFSIELKPALADLLLNYYADYIHAQTGNISYEAFINRLNFWMATGSGKTVVIVKLMERLGRLIQAGEVPPCDILFLTHRTDLIEQLRRHVAEFNTSHSDTPIVLHELKDYAAVKRERSSLFREQGITVFYYRSDNLSAQQKEKILDFRNYDNDGKWFVLLDEAHKGDREDSKRQHIYSILSRNGFLFNFSATFTDPRDIATTVCNFNLAEYIRRGYGKHLLVVQPELSAFRDKPEDDPDAEKRKAVLKMLIMLAYVRKVYARTVQPAGLYHRPLLLLLVNSVNPRDADLERFFRELELLARQGVPPDLWQAAKEALRRELEQQPEFLFEDEKVRINPAVWDSLLPEDLCQCVFNASSHGEIEVLLRPSNRQEMAFKLKTAERPFALIRIGDISAWLKEKLTGYEVVERFDHESLFAGLNGDASDINILLGSRSFYEGWDSNRPNVIGYINIGIGPDARKFILQSVGRGVRIEPIKNKRQRLLPLCNANDAEANRFGHLKDAVQPLETVFLFGTNRQAIQTVLDSLRKEPTAFQEPSLSGCEVSPQAKGHHRLIPVDKPAAAPPAKRPLPARFEIAPEDVQALQSFVQGADDRVLLALTDATPTEVKLLRDVLKDALKQNRVFTVQGVPSGDLRRLLRRVVAHLGRLAEAGGGLGQPENEIRHGWPG